MGSQEYKKDFLRNLLSFLVSSQIWVNSSDENFEKMVYG
jgi:hypothetical protein